MKCKTKFKRNIAIIGGADGPTAIYISKKPKEPKEHQTHKWVKMVAVVLAIGAVISLVAAFCRSNPTD